MSVWGRGFVYFFFPAVGGDQNGVVVFFKKVAIDITDLAQVASLVGMKISE